LYGYGCVRVSASASQPRRNCSSEIFEFNLGTPFRFGPDNPTVTDNEREARRQYGLESGYEFS